MQGITKYGLVIVTILGLIIPSLACIKIVRNEQTPTPNQGQTSNTVSHKATSSGENR